jgi:phosphoribosyl-AMP cyclohydrolase / phosphoribosyl-ATP pyrophosphohydrolase
MSITVDQLKFDDRGLIPAIVQDARTRRVLMLAYMNAESLQKTIETNETWFWSRSRSSLWHKGETSGNTQRVVEIVPDCDQDALTVLVIPNGPACHTGAVSCFEQSLSDNLNNVLEELYALVKTRKAKRPTGSYTTYLFDEGLDKILKKIGEESAETIIAAKGGDREELIRESADLLYHLVVLFVERDVSLEELKDELVRRRGKGPK